jgi:hypothetical protein
MADDNPEGRSFALPETEPIAIADRQAYLFGQMDEE